MANPKDILEFVVAVFPDVLAFVKDLYEAFDGDLDLTKQEIHDRRADIQRRRARNDEALRRKHSGPKSGG
jgi:hypothetical protein